MLADSGLTVAWIGLLGVVVGVVATTVVQAVVQHWQVRRDARQQFRVAAYFVLQRVLKIRDALAALGGDLDVAKEACDGGEPPPGPKRALCNEVNLLGTDLNDFLTAFARHRDAKGAPSNKEVEEVVVGPLRVVLIVHDFTKLSGTLIDATLETWAE